MSMSKTELNGEILNLLDEKVNEIFFEMQTELHILNGDITPLEKLELDNCMEKLADIIETVLKNQD